MSGGLVRRGAAETEDAEAGYYLKFVAVLIPNHAFLHPSRPVSSSEAGRFFVHVASLHLCKSHGRIFEISPPKLDFPPSHRHPAPNSFSL